MSRLLAGPASFANGLLPVFSASLLPARLVLAVGLALPWLEAVLGLLLLLGLRTRLALIAGALLLIVLTFGSTLRQDWQAAGIQLTYAMVDAALLAFRSRNACSLDALLSSTGA